VWSAVRLVKALADLLQDNKENSYGEDPAGDHHSSK